MLVVGALLESLIDARDRTLILVGFAGGLRRSELVGLNVEDVSFVPEGVLVMLMQSKTDQNGRGRKLGIPHGRNPRDSSIPVAMSRLKSAGLCTLEESESEGVPVAEDVASSVELPSVALFIPFPYALLSCLAQHTSDKSLQIFDAHLLASFRVCIFDCRCRPLQSVAEICQLSLPRGGAIRDAAAIRCKIYVMISNS
jgi:hypothetical protein